MVDVRGPDARRVELAEQLGVCRREAERPHGRGAARRERIGVGASVRGGFHRRRELVQGIATAFFAAPRRTANEINLFDEIMDKVLAEVEPLARRQLAERLADVADPPQRTLVRLAGDVIDVAEPVLTRSPALDDDLLEPIARTHSQDHLLAIARRKSLSSRLTDILVERGNDEVAGTVTGNDGARFSEAGFEWLAVRASAWPAGREEEEIRALWKAAHQKVWLDEAWLSALLTILTVSSPAADFTGVRCHG